VPVELRVNAADYGALSRALKRSEPTIRKNMRREISRATKPIIARAREQMRAAGGIPSEFRDAAARRVRLTQRDSPKRTQVAILAPPAGGQFQDAHRRINRDGSFRHPLFGRRARPEDWITQPGPLDWFDGPFKDARADIERAVKAAMDTAIAELQRAGK